MGRTAVDEIGEPAPSIREGLAIAGCRARLQPAPAGGGGLKPRPTFLTAPSRSPPSLPPPGPAGACGRRGLRGSRCRAEASRAAVWWCRNAPALADDVFAHPRPRSTSATGAFDGARTETTIRRRAAGFVRFLTRLMTTCCTAHGRCSPLARVAVEAEILQRRDVARTSCTASPPRRVEGARELRVRREERRRNQTLFDRPVDLGQMMAAVGRSGDARGGIRENDRRDGVFPRVVTRIGSSTPSRPAGASSAVGADEHERCATVLRWNARCVRGTYRNGRRRNRDDRVAAHLDGRASPHSAGSNRKAPPSRAWRRAPARGISSRRRGRSPHQQTPPASAAGWCRE